MKLFECQNCGQVLYFENSECERCGYPLGYLANQTMLSAMTDVGDGQWRTLADPGRLYRLCNNAAYNACNWLIDAGRTDRFCHACRFNRTIPNLDKPQNLLLWQRLEAAKHHLIYGLMRLDLPVASWIDETGMGLAFDFLESESGPFHDGPGVITGHAQGVITIDIAEADDAERERHRQDMAEPYRTLLGHFRHEVGHHYWERLIRGGVWHEAFREMFGDERQNYADALERHYSSGPQADWQEFFVSGYAGSHPWEDFAETWAHYLHIVDTLETAGAFGLRIKASAGRHPRIETALDFDAYEQPDFDKLIAAWLPLTFAVNSLTHSMGQPDLYPFVLAPAVMGKLRFIHGLIHGPLADERQSRTFAPGIGTTHSP